MNEVEESVTASDLAAAEASSGPVNRWAVHRRLYDWVLSFAHSKYSHVALFGLSFAESSFFPIPPDVLLGPLCLGHRRRSMRFAAIATAGSVTGAYLGYVIGMAFLWLVTMIPSLSPAQVQQYADWFREAGFAAVFVAALTPIPFKLLTIAAGAAHMDLLPFTLACIFGRSLRFFAVGGLFWWIGPKATPFIDKYFNWLCIIFVVLLIGGIALLKFVH